MMDLVDLSVQGLVRVEQPMTIEKQDLVHDHSAQSAQSHFEWTRNEKVFWRELEKPRHYCEDDWRQACASYDVPKQLAHTWTAMCLQFLDPIIHQILAEISFQGEAEEAVDPIHTAEDAREKDWYFEVVWDRRHQ